MNRTSVPSRSPAAHPEAPTDTLLVLPLDPLDRVTGSCTLVEHRPSGTRLLIDCGAYQGEDHDGTLSTAPFPFDPRQLTWVLLTHGHLDHCGRLPQLVADGFEGKVVATRETIAVAKEVLADAVRLSGDARLQEALDRIRWQPFGRKLFSGPFVLATNLFAMAYRTAHVVGAVSWEVIAGDPQRRHLQQRALFSGDVGCNVKGHETQPWLRERMAPFETRQLAVLESTYGGRTRDPETVDPRARRARLVAAVEEGLSRGGPVILPAFAVQRTHDVLLDLHLAMLEHPGFLDGVPLLLDAPMAQRLTPVMREAMLRQHISPGGKVRPYWLSKAFYAELGLDRDAPDDLEVARELVRALLADERPAWIPGAPPEVDAVGARLATGRAWTDAPWARFRVQWQPLAPGARRHAAPAGGRCVVLCTGGMCAGGPVHTWLAAHLERPEATVLLTGYCSGGTVGGQLLRAAGLPAHERPRLQGALALDDREVRLADVRATVGRLEGWSGHADQAGLVDWCFPEGRDGPFPVARTVWLQHGERRAREALKAAIEARAAALGLAIRVELPGRGGLAWDVAAEEGVLREDVLGVEPPADRDAALLVQHAADRPEIAAALARMLGKSR